MDPPEKLPFKDVNYQQGGQKPEVTPTHYTYSQIIEHRVNHYAIEILNPPRHGKKLLVLDLDFTLTDFDKRFVKDLARPYLHSFMASAYVDYDIVIWSATKMATIKTKLNVLGLLNDPQFKLSFCLDSEAIVQIHHQILGNIGIKPLELIWRRFSCYSEENTIMVDDNIKNFIKNPNNGIVIRAYHKRFANGIDVELLKMKQYLKYLAFVTNISSIDHRFWEAAIARKMDF